MNLQSSLQSLHKGTARELLALDKRVRSDARTRLNAATQQASYGVLKAYVASGALAGLRAAKAGALELEQAIEQEALEASDEARQVAAHRHWEALALLWFLLGKPEKVTTIRKQVESWGLSAKGAELRRAIDQAASQSVAGGLASQWLARSVGAITTRPAAPEEHSSGIGAVIQGLAGADKVVVDKAEKQLSDTAQGAFADQQVVLAPKIADELPQDSGVRSLLVWSSVLDGKTCRTCASNHGLIFKEDDTAGVLPAHPFCRCFWQTIFAPKDLQGGDLRKFIEGALTI